MGLDARAQLVRRSPAAEAAPLPAGRSRRFVRDRSAVGNEGLPIHEREVAACRRQTNQKVVNMTKTMRALLSISALALSVAVAVAPAAYAQDKMSKDGMTKDTMSKDGMKKSDTMSKDGMKSHDTMSKDGMAKDGMAKDGMKK
jgi:pentapeptide MXKDX repeat protein